MTKFCARCGLLDTFGHRCIPLATRHVTRERVTQHVTQPVTQHVTLESAIRDHVPDENKVNRSKGAIRQARYRGKDPAAYRQRHAEYMKDWARRMRAAARTARLSG
jgi:hypothetical protein